jgi:hypothetical protein
MAKARFLIERPAIIIADLEGKDGVWDGTTIS